MTAMSLIKQLYDKQSWCDFLTYKQASGHISRNDEADLKRFIESGEYVGTMRRIEESGFSIPQKRYVNKVHSTRKRVVYIFPRDENYVLKLLTFLLIRRYDSIFAENLFSFRARHGVRTAVGFLKGLPDLSDKYVYKADISDYFNSVDVERLLPVLRAVMAGDAPALGLIAALLTDNRVILPDGSIVSEHKGIMAGVPLSSFLANLYLKDLDWYFAQKHVLYARYSDDIILFAPTAEARDCAAAYIRNYLNSVGLDINPDKECCVPPHCKWTFLGVSFENGVFDVSEVSARKLMMKMRRKSRALLRWKARKHVDNAYAVRAFIKIINRKLYDNDRHAELTWTRWFFPLINTPQTLKKIDRYMQDCLRYVATERRNSRRYRFGYEDMKRLGYRSMVHEYYSIKQQTLTAYGRIQIPASK